MWLHDNSDIIIFEEDIDFPYSSNRIWEQQYVPIETSEFSEDGSFEILPWRDYCIKYCRSRKRDNIPAEYIVAIKEYNNKKKYFNIIRRKK
jgi:hypothetical protein